MRERYFLKDLGKIGDKKKENQITYKQTSKQKLLQINNKININKSHFNYMDTETSPAQVETIPLAEVE